MIASSATARKRSRALSSRLRRADDGSSRRGWPVRNQASALAAGLLAPVIIVPPDHHRSDRVSAAMREEIATFLANDVKDPRILGLVTVTACEISRDLRHAKVYVSVLGSESQRAATFEGLENVAGHLRGRVGRALRLRVAPEIEFKNDTSIAHAAHIEQLLAQVRKDLPADQTAPPQPVVSPPPEHEGRDD